MIEVELIGGLGNWLFQYAAGRTLALRHGTALTLNVARHQIRRAADVGWLRLFCIEADFSNIGRLGRRLRWLGAGERRPVYEERRWGFDPAFDALGADVRLIGYFQSARYFAGAEARIRTELAPRRLPDDPAFLAALGQIERTNAVSVHVRRGDYLSAARHNVCPPAYYLRAMERMRSLVEQPRFFVFSDDPAWCRRQLAADDVSVVEVAAAPVLDMVLMSRCQHHVICNSTFSWWAAWMNDRPGRIVLAPDRWFGDEEMSRLAMRDTVPAEWERVAVAP